MKYIVTFISAFIIEICSTFYISNVSEKNMLGMVFFAFISPFLSLPFYNYLIEEKTFAGRFKIAISLSLGYATSSFLLAKFFINQ